MEVRAKARFTGISARKARLVLNEIRGMDALEAMTVLDFMPQPVARVLSSTVKSALSNATENFGLEEDNMYIKRIYADKAPHRRWRRFAGRGRFKPWQRNSSHLTVVLDEREVQDLDEYNDGI